MDVDSFPYLISPIKSTFRLSVIGPALPHPAELPLAVRMYPIQNRKPRNSRKARAVGGTFPVETLAAVMEHGLQLQGTPIRPIAVHHDRQG